MDFQLNLDFTLHPVFFFVLLYCNYLTLPVLDLKSTHLIHYTSHWDEINCVGISNEFGKDAHWLIFEKVPRNILEKLLKKIIQVKISLKMKKII